MTSRARRPLFRGRLLRVACAALLASASASATPPDGATSCRSQLLSDLGWRFQSAEVDAIEIHGGTPCDRASLDEAHAAGDLVVRMPVDLDAAARDRMMKSLMLHPATRCAYGFALGDATRRAADRLAGNDGFRFTALQTGWIGFGAGGAARDGWQPIAWFGRGYIPRGRNSEAIAGFYDGSIRAECGVGRQIAQYAAQAELYGMTAFDEAFDADEIVIGTFMRIRPTRSILLGSSAGTYARDGRAVAASALGRQAFMGVPGFIFHVLDESTLDDINNQAENFVVYDVSAEAAAALREHAGFEHYNRVNHDAWLLARQIVAAVPAPRPYRYFERLLYERDPTLRAALPDNAKVAVAQLDALLDEPFYRGFRVYVHRQGIKPVAFHIVRLFDRNPRTPFRIEIGLHNVYTTLYDRYLAYRLDDCERGRLAARPLTKRDAAAR